MLAFNLVGYLTRESSLGDVARRLLAGLREADVPVSTIATQRTASPLLPDANPPDQRVAHETSMSLTRIGVGHRCPARPLQGRTEAAAGRQIAQSRPIDWWKPDDLRPFGGDNAIEDIGSHLTYPGALRAAAGR